VTTYFRTRHIFRISGFGFRIWLQKATTAIACESSARFYTAEIREDLLGRRKVYLFSLALLTLGGCVDRIMTINSDPDGALIYLNDQEIGRTPLTHDFQQYGVYQLEVRKEGYVTVKGTQVTEEPWWQLIPLDLVTELLPFHFKDIRNYHYTMAEASTQPADPRVMLERAGQMRGLLLMSPNTRIPTTYPTISPTSQAR
jgi:hypothetical protein